MKITSQTHCVLVTILVFFPVKKIPLVICRPVEIQMNY